MEKSEEKPESMLDVVPKKTIHDPSFLDIAGVKLKLRDHVQRCSRDFMYTSPLRLRETPTNSYKIAFTLGEDSTYEMYQETLDMAIRNMDLGMWTKSQAKVFFTTDVSVNDTQEPPGTRISLEVAIFSKFLERVPHKKAVFCN